MKEQILNRLENALKENEKTVFNFGGFNKEKNDQIQFLINAINYHVKTIDKIKKLWGDMRKADTISKDIYRDSKQELNSLMFQANKLLTD